MHQALLGMTDLRAAYAGAAGALLHWLGEDELARYRRFLRPERQRQFVAGRVLLRILLGELLDADPRSLRLQERAGQAPLLRDADPALGLSISHSGPWVAAAVSADTALGLDIEWIDPGRDIDAVAAHAFAPAQAQWLAARPAHSRVRDFYMLWSEHEARIKLGREGAHCMQLAHEEVSVVLCAAAPLERAPQLALRVLPQG